MIAAGQQKREGITPLTLVPRPLLLSVLALQGWRLCRLSPAPRGKSLRRSGPSPPRGPVEARIRPRIERQAGPTPPAGCPSLRRIAHSLTRGRAEAWNRPRNQWRAKPEPPCTTCRLRGGRGPPRSIFGHFLLIKKVATRGLGFCLTISQTDTLPMAQAKKNPNAESESRIEGSAGQQKKALSGRKSA